MHQVKRNSIKIIAPATALTMALVSASAFADRITVRPNDVPDEQPPRVVNDSPTNFGPNSWQGPSGNETTGSDKTNWHAIYGDADGDGDGDESPLSRMLGEDVAKGLTLADLTEISYRTNRPSGSNQDWFLQIYTRDGSFADPKFTNNFDTHTTTGEWTTYTATDDNDLGPNANMTFEFGENGQDDDGTSGADPEMDLGELATNYGDKELLAVSVHTNTSNSLDGFDGYMDGLVIKADDGNGGTVTGEADFSAIPEPMSLGLVGVGVGLMLARRRRWE